VAVAKKPSLYAAKKETAMVATLSMNNFRATLSGNTKSSKLQLFATLPMYFRNENNLAASRKFIQYSLALARDLYDDFDSPTSFRSGVGFSLLA